MQQLGNNLIIVIKYLLVYFLKNLNIERIKQILIKKYFKLKIIVMLILVIKLMYNKG